MEGETARSQISLTEVGTEEFLQKLTSQITEIVSAKISQGNGGSSELNAGKHMKILGLGAISLRQDYLGGGNYLSEH